MNKSSQAFTLVEMAMVMVIVGFLLSRFLIPLATQIDQQRIQVTEQRLQEIKEALIGYVIVNRHLPCPAVGLDGRAEAYDLAVGTGGPTVCANDTNGIDGYLPWADLGVPQYDGWNHPFRYRADGAFSDGLQYSSGTELSEAAVDYLPITEHFLKVQNLAGVSLVTERGANYRANNPNAPLDKPAEKPRLWSRSQYGSPGINGSLGSEVVALVFSCGKNGKPDGRRDPNNPMMYLRDFNFIQDPTYNTIEYFSNDADGQVNSDAQCTNPFPSGLLERKTNYIQDAYVEESFDDILVWLPRNLVIQRMIAAGIWSFDLKRYALQIPFDNIFAGTPSVKVAATNFKNYLLDILPPTTTIKLKPPSVSQKYHQVYIDLITLDKVHEIQKILSRNRNKIEKKIEEIFNSQSLPPPPLPLQDMSKILYP